MVVYYHKCNPEPGTNRELLPKVGSSSNKIKMLVSLLPLPRWPLRSKGLEGDDEPTAMDGYSISRV